MNVIRTGILTAILVLGAGAEPYAVSGDPPDGPERGEYLATVAGCRACHSPLDGPAFSGNVVERNGERVYAPNLTPSAGGPGGWTRDEMRRAITTGLTPEGRQLHPLMPYLFYNGMADADLDALLDYLQTLEPVESEPSPPPDLSAVQLPPPPPERNGIVAPDPADQVAYGEYLSEAVLACGACHTPLLGTGEPDRSRWLAGGQAFRGEWGTVYAGNLTPDPDTGLGLWPDEAILLALVNAQHPTHRPLYDMIHQRAYNALSGRDAEAVLAYLRALPPIVNEVPPPELREGYEEPPPEGPSFSLPAVILTVFMMLALLGLALYVGVRQYRFSQRVLKTDWAEYYSNLLAEARRAEARAEKEEQDDSPPEER
ncbi:MAG TPA: c-type cytochrome [Chloroflexi bacterium]|nr:c-type cytochrome [Chloroflexota bacterium]